MADQTDDPCRGCGGECSGETPAECRGPDPIPWLPFDRCMFFYESRVFAPAAAAEERLRLQIRVSYEHCLRLIGRQQGPLLYTTTLLPGESVDLYEFDRYRRTRADSEQLSVHSSFRQSLSTLSQTRRFSSASAYADLLVDVRTRADTSVSAGGGLAGFFGAPSVKGDLSVAAETTAASGSSVSTVSEQFTQNAATASQSTDAERSLVISHFEDAEQQSTTRRTLSNKNDCFAVTYFVRRVMEAYESRTRVVAIEWQLGDGVWRTIDDLANVPDAIRKAIEVELGDLPKPGEEERNERQITLPTDGTLYEAELAHCSSCEPAREERMRIELEQARLRARRACLEDELLSLEIDRRKALASGDSAVALDVGAWPLSDDDDDAGPEPPMS